MARASAIGLELLEELENLEPIEELELLEKLEQQATFSRDEPEKRGNVPLLCKKMVYSWLFYRKNVYLQ